MSAWNKYQENILKKWSSMSKTYSIMHSASSEYYNKWDKRFGVPVILLGAVAASSIFTTSSDDGDDSRIMWSYINGSIVLLMTGISGVSKFLGTHEKQTKHTSAAFKYIQISMNIDTLLSFPRTDREEKPRAFINSTKLAILEVREHSPYLPTWVVSSYINKFEKSMTNTRTNVNRNKTSEEQYNKIRRINEWDDSAISRSSNGSGKSESNKKTHDNKTATMKDEKHLTDSDDVVVFVRDDKTEKIQLPNKKQTPGKNRLYTGFTDNTSEQLMHFADKLECEESDCET
jgi:hypothetical protein